MGVGEGDDMDGREKDGKRDMSGRKKRERETGMGEKDREAGAGKRDIGRETGVGARERESERDRGKRRRDRGEREKITNTKNSWNFILWYFTRQNGVKHDKCRATIHCRASIRLPETRWERKR